MANSEIVVRGAREHNLRNVELTLPRGQLICFTGVSGSGKSSLAFDTLYAEGQRRYVESLSSFARQFLGQMPKPDVDFIGGLSPSISISQKTSGQNPRSTVGTITEIYDYLRVLFARVGQGHCSKCRRPITAQTREQIVERIASLPAKTKYAVLAPLVRRQKGEFKDLFADLLKQGFNRARVDGRVVSLSADIQLDRQMRHDIELVVDRLVAGDSARGRLAEAVELALRMGEGNLIVAQELETDATRPADTDTDGEDQGDDAAEAKPKGRKKRRPVANEGDLSLSAHYACTHCGLSFEPPSPQLFSFNSPQGMCLECDGLGEVYSFLPERVVTHPEKSFQDGCFELIGTWKDMGRWRRHIYQGVAESMEHVLSLPEGTLVETPWNQLAPEHQAIWLFGTGDQHITFAWKSGSSAQKYGGRWEGLIPNLLSRYRQSKSKMQQRSLEAYMSVIPCQACAGTRLNPQARAVTVTTRNPRFAENPARSLPDVSALSVSDAADFFGELELDATHATIASEVLKEVCGRLGFLVNVGLEYLSLDRTAPTLSGGESQRIRLAGQIGCGLVGVLYILDEPSIGLHPRDNDRLLATLHRLRDQGNTVIVVEHDEDTMRAADHLVDFGPGPGVRGGHIVAHGAAEDVAAEAKSLTGQFLSGAQAIEVPAERRKPGDARLRVLGARHNNLKNVDAEIPVGLFVCVTGVSGSGKSSLVNDILVEALRRDLNGGEGTPGLHDKIEGMEHLDKLIAIDQSPIGRTPRSNPSTYIKLFDDIRTLYTQLPDSKSRGFKPGRFSFNVAGGRCEACEGNGSTRLEMDFLADVWVTCPVCQGHRFNRETLQVRFKGKSIADVLEMDVQQALVHFENVPHVRHKLQTLHDVGLDYLKLGQPSPTLSGGEAQRIKLARELVKKSTGRTLYLLDEPTTGLHFADIKKLIEVLQGFVEAGNTVLVVEHNLDVVKTADWLIDLGPEGGAGGGRILTAGPPEQIADCKESQTGRSLAAFLAGQHPVPRRPAPANSESGEGWIRVRGARQHNLKGIDVDIPRDLMTVCCGPSGSGKTSLAMDTIYAEGQRRYVESLSSYARQFVGQMQKPQLEHIEGLSPAIAIEQKHLGHTPRSTVGTVTEIYDYFRILLARLGEPHCPACDAPIGTQTPDQIVDKLLAEPAGTKLYLLAPIEVEVGRSYASVWDEVRASGYVRIRVDGQTYSTDEPPQIDRRSKHQVEVVVDRISVREESRSRISDSVESALSLGRGVIRIAWPVDDMPEPKWPTAVHSQHFACDRCGRSFEPLTPHHFSFNSALGWCESCQGLGTQVGANPTALIRDPKLTLGQGAVLLWPEVSGDLFPRMLAALAAHTGLPLDVPFGELNARQRRIVFHGLSEDEWIDVPAKGQKKGQRPLFRFQYKGLYPALEEASRLAPSVRGRLEHLVGEVECSTCSGSRLREDAAAVRFRNQTIDQFCRQPLGPLLEQVKGWKLSARDRKIAGELVREISNRLEFMNEVGLEYLTLGRPAPTLSGGEAQRIRLASQVGSGLCGVLYVLDEPTIGLHPRDNRRLLRALEKLRDLGNTLLLVEHDKEVVEAADRLLDFGPAAGEFGGQVMAAGTPSEVAKQKGSVTGPFLSGAKAIAVPTNRRMPSAAEIEAGAAADNGKPTKKIRTRKAAAEMAAAQPSVGVNPWQNFTPPGGGWLEVIGARHHNLKNVSAAVPLGTFTAVTGVSGSGKSTLVEDVLYAALARVLHRAGVTPAPHDAIRGLEFINKVIRVDQQPLGNSPTSNPATYTGAFEHIRQLFAQLPEAKVRGYTPRRFSFNVPGGRCERCEGNGQLKIEMHFLPDIWVECDTCRGQRYNPETLSVRFHGQSIADVLDMSCGKALTLFENIPTIRRILQTICDVGLDYVRLGQPAPTLSGGEAQRVKLAAELARPDTGNTLYLLDEPTTGLHFSDLLKLLDVLNRLVDLGNTVLVIEHNLDIIKTADWVIDMGPEAGEGGGQVVAAGTPEDIVAHAQQSAAGKRPRKGAADSARLRSYTGEMLAEVIAAGPHAERKPYDPNELVAPREGDVDIAAVGKAVKMPWETDGRRWHTQERVGRGGQPCRWDGQILARALDRIEAAEGFSATDYSSRTVVEVCGETKSDGWFFHAITGEEWLLKLKFRVARRTFDREELVKRLDLRPLDEMPDLPVYGPEPRVQCKNLRGPWQEIQLRVHSLAEVDKPAFWQFVDEAIAGFQKLTVKKRESPEDISPWKVLGRKWHFSRKGFPPGKRVGWEGDVLEELCELLSAAAPGGQFLWNNQQVVHLCPAGQSEPWATVATKRLSSVDLTLFGPRGAFALGAIADLGAEREVSSDRGRDAVKLKFVSLSDLHQGDLSGFLKAHLAAANKSKKAVGAAE